MHFYILTLASLGSVFTCIDFIHIVLTLKKLEVLTQDVLSLVPLYNLNVSGFSWDVGDEHVT